MSTKKKKNQPKLSSTGEHWLNRLPHADHRSTGKNKTTKTIQTIVFNVHSRFFFFFFWICLLSLSCFVCVVRLLTLYYVFHFSVAGNCVWDVVGPWLSISESLRHNCVYVLRSIHSPACGMPISKEMEREAKAKAMEFVRSFVPCLTTRAPRSFSASANSQQPRNV